MVEKYRIKQWSTGCYTIERKRLFFWVEVFGPSLFHAASPEAALEQFKTNQRAEKELTWLKS